MNKGLYKRGHKIYLDRDNKIESDVNQYLNCRDGVVEMIEYRDDSGYGSWTKLYLCRDIKHESVCLIRQVECNGLYSEESLYFDSDSFEQLQYLLGNGKRPHMAEIKLLRDYE